MAKKRTTKTSVASESTGKPPSPHLLAILLLAVATLVFHWEPLFNSQTSIQWDSVDTFYSPQKYFADHIRQGELPHWTPYLFSGYPFLADPQVGAWYPLNWPFFLAGITPGAIQLGLALHSLIAALGAYLLAWGMLRNRATALVAAVAYAFSGYFAGEASHLGVFQTAVWLPWILLAVERGASEDGIGPKMAAGLLTGVMALAGHFQTALYTGFAVAAYSVWLCVRDRSRWVSVAGTLTASGVIGVALAAVMIVPAAELAEHSVRKGMDFSNVTNSPLIPSTLGTLIYPNLFGLHDGNYSGPEDVTQHYFYAGILLLPLAVLGLTDRRARWAGLALTVPAAWYALGPAGGLYAVLSKLPGLGSVRAPVQMWFVVALGLALLAGAGAGRALERWKLPWLGWALAAAMFGDMYWFNSATNPLAYARSSFAELYGDKLARFEQKLAAQLPPLTRFHAPYSLVTFGPQNHPLDARAQTTYGYNPLRLRNYNEYMSAAAGNPRLLAELGVKFRLNPQAGGVEASEDILPRVTIPKKVVTVANEEAAAKALGTLDPRESAVVAGLRAETQDADGLVSVVSHGEGSYRLRYKVQSPTLIRVAEVYYPGWEAESGSQVLPVMEVDRALMGVVVPAGEGEVAMRFRLRRFGAASGVSLGAAMAAAALMLRTLLSRRRASPTPTVGPDDPSGPARAT